MDIAVLSVGLWLLPLMSTAEAVYWGAVLVSPLLLLALGFAVAWAARPLTGPHMSWFAGLVAVVQPVVVVYSIAGRPDHHTLLMVATIVMVGSAVRLVVNGSDQPARVVAVGGLAGAVSLWIAVESLIWVGLVFSAGVVAFVAGRGPLARTQRVWWSWFAGGALAGAVGDHGLGFLAEIEYDRISLPHVFLSALAVAFWVIVERWGQRSLASRARLTWISIAAAGAGLAMGVLFPSMYRGPLVAVPGELQQRWLWNVNELQSIIDRGWTSALAYVLVPFIGLGVASILVLRSSGRARLGWSLVVTLLLVGIAMAFSSIRFAVFPELLGAIPTAAGAGLIIERVQHHSSVARVVVVVGLVSSAVVGHLVLSAFGGGSGAPQAPGVCDTRTATAIVRRSTPVNAVVLAAIDLGPEILFRTDARVVGAPYHRNLGILDVLDAFEGDPATVSRPIIDERGIGYVLFCAAPAPSAAEQYPAGSLGSGLAHGWPPDYLDQIDEQGGWVYYRVVP